MSEQYQNTYRVPSARLQNWDYGWNASYFVTICTRGHEHYFGNVVEGAMNLSEMGKIAHAFWRQIPEHFPFVLLDVFVVMPNHVHGIIIIDKDDSGPSGVETHDYASLPDDNRPKNKFGPQSQNLASIIRGYKSAVKKYATMHQINFAWQPRYHDHIIRDDKSLETIQEYIVHNPVKWEEDKYYAQ